MSDGWPNVPLSDLVVRVTEKNSQGLDRVMTVSARHGLVAQEAFFTKRVASRDMSGYSLVQPGDYVYNKSYSVEAPIGVIARNADAEPGVVSPLYIVFRPATDQLAHGFLDLAVKSSVFSESLRGLLKKGARAHGALNVKPADFFTAKVPLPPLPAQQRIVELIDAIDEQVLGLEQEQRALDRLWWSVAAALESASSFVTSIPLGEVADISGGLTKNKNTALVGVPVVVPYLRVANVHRRYLDLADLAQIATTTAVVERLRLKPGDVLLNEGGDKDKLGRGAVWKGQVENCIHQNHVFRARVTDDRFNAGFVSAWANSFGQGWFETYGTQTTGIASISKSTLSKFPVPLLPKEEQLRWAAALDGVFDVMTRLAAEADVLRGLRTRILHGLFSREIALPDVQDQLMDAGVA